MLLGAALQHRSALNYKKPRPLVITLRFPLYPDQTLGEELSDIDFEDSYAYLYFRVISISDRNCKTWTKKRIKEVIVHIKEDMEFDGDKVNIELEDDSLINSPGNHEISLCCEVKEFGVG